MEVVIKIIKLCHHDLRSCSAIIRDGKVPTDWEQSRVNSRIQKLFLF